MNLREAAEKAYTRIDGLATGLGSSDASGVGYTVSDFDITLSELQAEMRLLLLNAQENWNQVMDADPHTSVNDLLDGIVAGAWHHGLLSGLLKERG